MSPDLDEPVMPSDFRRAWPRALARTIEQAQSIVEANQAVAAELKSTTEKVVALAKLTPGMMSQAEESMRSATERTVHNIQLSLTSAEASMVASQVHFLESQSKFMESIEREKAAVDHARAKNERVLAEIHRAQVELERERREFNSRPLLRRIFGKA